MRAAIVGLGRIGRALFRINLERGLFDMGAIVDINPDLNNLAYLLNYDSNFGPLPEKVTAQGKELRVGQMSVPVFSENSIESVPWEELDIDVVIEASGVHHNVLGARKLLGRGVKKVLVTHCPDEVDHTLVLGANEASYDPDKHQIVSSSICDTVAVAPVLRIVDEAFGIESGFLTTLHPWLAYQNLLDGPSYSWAWPGEIYHHYAVGRAGPGTLIPKPTSAIEATLKVLPHLQGTMQCMSFRVPTPIVGAANLYLRLKDDAHLDDLHSAFDAFIEKQVWHILKVQNEPLVSVDFVGSVFSATVDRRWTSLAGPRHVYLVLWYDNEWGYSSRVLDLAAFLLGVESEPKTQADLL